MAVAITIVLVAIAIVAHVTTKRTRRTTTTFPCVCASSCRMHLHPRGTRDVAAKYRLMHRSEKLVCLAPLRHRSFRCARWLSWCLNPTPMVALPNSKWTLAHCSARSGHFAQLEVAQLEVGTCRRERNSKRTLAQTLAQLRNLLKWTLADTCSSVALAHLDICSHGLHWTLATTRPTTPTTTNDHGLSSYSHP